MGDFYSVGNGGQYCFVMCIYMHVGDCQCEHRAAGNQRVIQRNAAATDHSAAGIWPRGTGHHLKL